MLPVAPAGHRSRQLQSVVANAEREPYAPWHLGLDSNDISVFDQATNVQGSRSRAPQLGVQVSGDPHYCHAYAGIAVLIDRETHRGRDTRRDPRVAWMVAVVGCPPR